MADEAQVIKEFLISIGFNVDDASFSRFDSAVASTTLRVIKLGMQVEETAAGVVLGVAKIADSMEKLYFASQRTHASVENIQAFSFAVAQMGGTANDARASLENLGNFLRSSPAAASLLQNNLGVSTTANGKPRDETAIMADLAVKFAAMPFWQAQVYASRLGIDQNTLIAMINGLGGLEQAYKKMYAAAGLDPTGGSGQAHSFMIQLRELGAAFEILSIKAEAALSGPIGADLERFRLAIVANFGNITNAIVFAAKMFVILSGLFDTVFVTAFGLLDRLYESFRRLTPAQQQWIESIAGLIVAWRFLNIAFSLSPLGRIIALGAALLLLYQDYETWKAGGKSLIDWAKWEPDIEKAKRFLEWLGPELVAIAQSVGGWQAIFDTFLVYFTGKWAVGIIARLATILGMIAAIGRGMMGIAVGGAAGGAVATDAVGTVGKIVAGVFGGAMGLLSLPNLLDASELALSGDTANNSDASIWADGMGAYRVKSIQATESQFQVSDPEDNPLPPVAGKNGQARSGGSMANDVRDYLVKTYGISPGAADGLVANMMAESGLDPSKVIMDTDGKIHAGIGMWDPDRQAEFARLYRRPLIGSSLQEQLDFYMAEITGHTRNNADSAKVGQLMASSAFSSASEANQASAMAIADSMFNEKPAGGTSTALLRAKLAQGYSGSFKPVAAPGASIVQHNVTTITVPTSSTAASLAAQQSKVHERNARNLQTAVNKAN